MDSATAAVLYATTVSIPAPSAVPEDAAGKRHHLKGGGFINPWESWNMMSTFSIMYNMIRRRLVGTANVPNTRSPTVKVHKPQFLSGRSTSKLRATWLGHACYYVEFPGGLRVLFDPVFEDRCSPFSWLGPKRYTKMPCEIDELPFVDAVIISHNHYDHLSLPTIKRIHERYPGCHFFAPLGNKQWFSDRGISNMTELDWWEEREVALSPTNNKSSKATVVGDGAPKPSDIMGRVGCLPCQHMSNRTLWDRSKTLWSSWSVESGGSKVYFAGDTGYRTVPELPKQVDDYGPGHNYPHCPAFAQVGALRGPFDLGLIPIGAYDPRFIMSPMHADPHDAVNIFRDTKCARALGMHWGTWVLTEEDVREPPEKLKQALTRHGIQATGVFDVCEIGESTEF